MKRPNNTTIRIISILILAVFLHSQAAPAYALRVVAAAQGKGLDVMGEELKDSKKSVVVKVNSIGESTEPEKSVRMALRNIDGMADLESVKINVETVHFSEPTLKSREDPFNRQAAISVSGFDVDILKGNVVSRYVARASHHHFAQHILRALFEKNYISHDRDWWIYNCDEHSDDGIGGAPAENWEGNWPRFLEGIDVSLWMSQTGKEEGKIPLQISLDESEKIPYRNDGIASIEFDILGPNIWAFLEEIGTNKIPHLLNAARKSNVVMLFSAPGYTEYFTVESKIIPSFESDLVLIYQLEDLFREAPLVACSEMGKYLRGENTESVRNIAAVQFVIREMINEKLEALSKLKIGSDPENVGDIDRLIGILEAVDADADGISDMFAGLDKRYSAVEVAGQQPSVAAPATGKIVVVVDVEGVDVGDNRATQKELNEIGAAKKEIIAVTIGKEDGLNDEDINMINGEGISTELTEKFKGILVKRINNLNAGNIDLLIYNFSNQSLLMNLQKLPGINIANIADPANWRDLARSV